mmetsp:Transcript_21036/g.53521  ORF Transcript_21036/g.53521 Transcript_21036/m.53521 type:complete len:198 (+) Transcript_21036:947-1540(+)
MLDVPFEVVVSGFAEDLPKHEYKASEYVAANARVKCEAVARMLQPQAVETGRAILVIGADTVIAHLEAILEKPRDDQDAKAMLRALSGTTHHVYTGVCIGIVVPQCPNPVFESDVATTEVTFLNLSDEDINAYVATGEPMDKAGSYALQGKGSLLVESIKGCYWNVVGLPLSLVARTDGLLDRALEQATAGEQRAAG